MSRSSRCSSCDLKAALGRAATGPPAPANTDETAEALESLAARLSFAEIVVSRVLSAAWKPSVTDLSCARSEARTASQCSLNWRPPSRGAEASASRPAAAEESSRRRKVLRSPISTAGSSNKLDLEASF